MLIPLTPANADRPTTLRALGALVGAAVGDALGAPFEFQPRGTYTRRFPAPVLGGIGEMIGGGGFRWEPGEFTDDTQMGLALAESLVTRGGYDPQDVWLRFRAWGSGAKDIGNTIRRSLRHADWRDVAADSGHLSAGNGALMRAFPLALAYLHTDTATVVEVVLHQAALTHQDPAAGWGAFVGVQMMRAAIRGEDPLQELDAAPSLVPAEVWSTFAPLLDAAWTPDAEGDHVSNGTVWGCLAQAVWALRSTSSFEDAVVAAVSFGDDADTVGCVAGALAGARYGVQAIPSRWTTYVHGRVDTPAGASTYDNAGLQDLARKLIGAGKVPVQAPEAKVQPVAVAPRLHAADLGAAALMPKDHAVVSLCRTEGRMAKHPVRREVYLVDKEGDHNPDLGVAVRDAVDSVDALLAEGRDVVVHCHGGRSRTGLILKAWKMRTDGCTEREAHQWLAARWERYEDYNQTFVRFLQTEWVTPRRP